MKKSDIDEYVIPTISKYSKLAMDDLEMNYLKTIEAIDSIVLEDNNFHFKLVIDLIDEYLIKNVEKAMRQILARQDKLNIEFSKNDRRYIEIIASESFKELFDETFDFSKKVELHKFYEISRFPYKITTLEFYKYMKNTIMNNIDLKIKWCIKEDVVNRKNIKYSNSDRIALKSNWISILALFLSLSSFIYSIFFK